MGKKTINGILQAHKIEKGILRPFMPFDAHYSKSHVAYDTNTPKNRFISILIYLIYLIYLFRYIKLIIL